MSYGYVTVAYVAVTIFPADLAGALRAGRKAAGAEAEASGPEQGRWPDRKASRPESLREGFPVEG